jgi:hypothetical protein
MCPGCTVAATVPRTSNFSSTTRQVYSNDMAFSYFLVLDLGHELA